jgi:hypothetical protein
VWCKKNLMLLQLLLLLLLRIRSVCQLVCQVVTTAAAVVNQLLRQTVGGSCRRRELATVPATILDGCWVVCCCTLLVLHLQV